MTSPAKGERWKTNYWSAEVTQKSDALDLEPGVSKVVSFSLHYRDLSVVDAAGVRRIVPGEVKVWIGGGQPVAGPGQMPGAGMKTGFRITSAATLPD